MNVSLEKTFALPGAPERAWALLQNIESVAACMPGAKIVEKLDEQHYKGTVSVKFGPATMSFRGEIEVRDVNQSESSLRLIGKGTDSTGSSGASMDLTARIEPADGGNCNLIGQSEVSVSGKAAAFGGRMMNAVADQVLKQFASNFAAQLQNMPDGPDSGAAQAAPAVVSADAASADQANAPGSGAASVAGAAPASELNALSLVWGMMRDWFRSLFAPKKL